MGRPLKKLLHATNWSTIFADVDRLRRRVRLYLLVMLSVDLLAYVSDWLGPLLFGVPTAAYPAEAMALRYSVTLVMAAAWAFTRFTRPGRITLIAIDTAVTLGLVLVYAHIAKATMVDGIEDFGPPFALFGIVLLLSVRAAFVPSPVIRTFLIGVVSMLCFFWFSRDSLHALDPYVQDGLRFIAGAFILATSATSHVIFGLQREVREALRLGQYTLEGKLGQGGMGEVYRAKHALLQRDAAIKLIRPELAGSGTSRDRALPRFEREARVTASLRSPHTVELYDFGVSEAGAFYYVMELLDGIDLQTGVARYGPMPASRVVFLLRQVCDSLEEAHVAGLVHRDIKPANIFVCRYGLRYDFVKVLDFGLVSVGLRENTGAAELTMEGFVGGTPAYLAPEMASRAHTVDGRADVYSVGCVAYWLLTGRAPFERDSALATVLAHVNDPPIPPSQVTELPVPASLESLVLACLAKSPDDRPASAEELARRLEFAGREAEANDGGSSWNADEARAWWETHRPERSVTEFPADVSPLTVTKTMP